MQIKRWLAEYKSKLQSHLSFKISYEFLNSLNNNNIIIQPNVDIWSMWTEMLKKRCNFYNLTYNKNL